MTTTCMTLDEIEFWKKNYIIGIDLYRMSPSMRPPMITDNMDVADTPAQYAAIFANASIEELRASINRFAELGSDQEYT